MIKLKIQEKLSPTSINAYMHCPRGYYYQYVVGVKPEPSIHLVRGTIVHSVLEDFFKSYPKDFDEAMMAAYRHHLDANKEQLAELGLSDEELAKENKLTEHIVTAYLFSFRKDVEHLIMQEKAENEKHAYYLLKPKFRELYLSNDELHCHGYLDRVHEDWDGNIIIGDYKTSSLYGIGLTEDYRRQISIYALLFYLEKGQMPDFGSVIYLRYGKEILLEVTPRLLETTRELILEIYEKTRSTDIKDYPPRHEVDEEGSLCRWCPDPELCRLGEEDEEEKTERLQKLLDR